MSNIVTLDPRRERALRDALDKLDEIEARLRQGQTDNFEAAFARLAPVAAALIERGERDD